MFVLQHILKNIKGIISPIFLILTLEKQLY